MRKFPLGILFWINSRSCTHSSRSSSDNDGEHPLQADDILSTFNYSFVSCFQLRAFFRCFNPVRKRTDRERCGHLKTCISIFYSPEVHLPFRSSGSLCIIYDSIIWEISAITPCHPISIYLNIAFRLIILTLP